MTRQSIEERREAQRLAKRRSRERRRKAGLPPESDGRTAEQRRAYQREYYLRRKAREVQPKK